MSATRAAAFVALLLCAAFLLLGGGAALADTAAPASPSLQLEKCRLKGVSTQARCGTLEVFEDREGRTGRRIKLRVVVFEALAASKEPDPLFFLAGGPGQAATEVAPLALLFFREVRQNRDLVFVDQRGTGSSNPLDCELESDDDASKAFSDEPFDPAELKACLEGYDADATKYVTPLAMDDLDDVRAALGYEHINLYGGSYGTRAALVYARRHGDHTRSVILDGSAPFAIRLPFETGPDAQRAFDKLLADCEADATCKAAFGDLGGKWTRLLEELAAEPRKVAVRHPRTAENVDVTVTADGLAGAVRGALYDPTLASVLPLAIERAVTADDFAPLAAATGLMSGAVDLSMGMFLSVVCAEDLPRVSEEELASARAGSRFARAGVVGIAEACAIWPRAELPASYFEPVRSDVPTLLLSGDLDPVTPPRWGDVVAKNLSRARHVIAPGTGHGVMSRGCAPKILARFIESADPEAVQTDCLDKLRRPPFFVTPNGPRARAK
jgi:pimeloyl-ACP methyl ester carboxylesterase